MKIVKVEFTVETEDFGAEEFRHEIEDLVKEIDPDTALLSFKMYEIDKEKEKK